MGIEETIQYLSSPTERGKSSPPAVINRHKSRESTSFAFDTSQSHQRQESVPTIITQIEPTILKQQITLNEVLNGPTSVPSQSGSPSQNGLSQSDKMEDIPQLKISLKGLNVSSQTNISLSGHKQRSIDSIMEELDVISDTETMDSPKTYFNRKQIATNIIVDENDDTKNGEVLISEEMDQLSMKIFCQYIQIGAMNEVNISSGVKRDLQKIFKPELYYKDKQIAKQYSISQMCIADKFIIFDIAAEQIENMMRNDTFARFKRTKEFTDFVKTWSIKK